MWAKVRKPLLLFLLLIAAAVALLAIAAVDKSQDFEKRGIPAGLHEPVEFGGAELGFNVSLEQFDSVNLDATLQDISGMGVRYVKQAFYFCGD